MIDHTARPESWILVEAWATNEPFAPADCIMELLSRVVRLEQAQQQQPAPSTPAGLVSGVAALIARFASTALPGDDCTPAARDTILAVILWLESQAWPGAADALRREVGR